LAARACTRFSISNVGFTSRVLADPGLRPPRHYKNSRIKQYHKEGRALRTETTINNTRDFGIGKLLKNLPALRQVGFQANRRLLDVQTALQFGDARVQALINVLVLFSFQLRGFTNQEMRAHWLNCWASIQPITPSVG
jgi:hypothetical protein